jgi:hypothetical protein
LLLVVALLAFAAGCKSAKKNPNVLEGGEMKYSMSGRVAGIVDYAAGVRPQDAASIGEWLREKGWFLTREENRSALTGKARGTYMSSPDAKVAGRVRSERIAKVRPRGAGLEIIVYTDPQWADSTDVSEFGAESAPELSKRVAKPVRFVVRGEKSSEKDVEWQDVYWDFPEPPAAAALSNGK